MYLGNNQSELDILLAVCKKVFIPGESSSLTAAPHPAGSELELEVLD